MNVNKKLGRFKQWAGEKMGGEAKTDTSEDFKALEIEMNLRHEGMEKLQQSMTLYVKSISRKEAEGREKMLPVEFLGQTMVAHGQDFQADSEFGNCLIGMGRANESLARKQESYVSNATSCWLESLERSLAQMKEYQAARRKLETRRLAYDASLAKMQKAKKEDFRVEEELRAQKAKYEESNEDVYRRMEDIKEAEVDSVADLTAFLEAELSYYDSCRQTLLQLKQDWPGASAKKSTRTRSNTIHSYSGRQTAPDEEEEYSPPSRGAIAAPGIGSARSSRGPSPRPSMPDLSVRPSFSRTVTHDSASENREFAPIGGAKISRVPTEPSALLTGGRLALRPTAHRDQADQDRDERFSNIRSDSPTATIGSLPSRTTSWSTVDTTPGGSKKIPPPPPSRAKKPAPPPPPMKRSALSTSQIPTSPH
ncbi:hypothetical protein BLS_009657 [Venturia inaequalis]|uniref:BAR domain-containing protein n=1 Tax=Venturia inaequalis TaxID=5025 RepID=A0A8H3Z4L9_VENIN|nr:hypothetical protein EG328_009621 [Venturia inaequalis]KAE9985179.1 hypothetical protein BLS_009657 [Venturia inaequalis]KAE9993204.1 hypothetical protein EG327_006005 [Venturia inaequalis]RDI86612.1 hypothetical protein Vi05172_g3550 [Venturia inaequalis]